MIIYSPTFTGSVQITGSQTVTGDLTVQGNLTAQTFILSSSVSYFTESFASGSTRFGDSMDDTMKVTGSLLVTGSGTFAGALSGNNYTATSTGNANVFNAASATTGWVQIAMNNTNGSAILGLEGNTAGTTTNGSLAYATILRNYTATALQIATNNIVRATITSGGDVGIGITNPSAGLEVATNGASLNAIRSTTTQTYNTGPETSIVFRYKHNTAGDYTTGALINIAKDNTTDGNQSGNLQFWTNNAGTAAERMRITSAGNVGFGTSVVTEGTQAAGSISIFPSSSVSSAPLIQFPGNGRIRPASTSDRLSIEGNALYLNNVFSGNIIMATGGGNVLIGSASDQGGWKAQVTGNMFIRGSNTTSANTAIYTDNSAGTLLFSVRNDGYMNIGLGASSPYNDTTATAANLVVNSDGSLLRSTASSQRFKENINDWNGGGLDTILSLKPKTFNYKESYYKYPQVEMLGLIAEEVAEVSPYLADFQNEDRTGQVENVRYATIVIPLIKAIQELKAEIDELKNK